MERVVWPIWPVVLLVVALAVPAARAPDFTLASESHASQFGLSIAAAGPIVAVADLTAGCGRSGPCQGVLRIARVVGPEIVDEARFVIPDELMVLHVAAAGSTVVARSAMLDELQVYRRVRGRWRRSQVIRLSAPCVDPGHAFEQVRLSEQLMIVESRTAHCVFEPRGARWELTGTLAHDAGTELALAGERVAVVELSRVRILRRVDARWQLERTIVAPADHGFEHVAYSGRWLVTRDHALEQLYVYDLDAGGLAILPNQVEADGRFATALAISETALVATGDVDELWRFERGRWRPRGRLAGRRNEGFLRRPALADQLWIGSAPLANDRAGVVHGFRL